MGTHRRVELPAIFAVHQPLRIVFMGTPAFAVPSLQILLDNGYDIAAVVTAPDRPSGRGLQLQPSAVKKFSIERGLKVLQPTNLKDPEWLSALRALDADLQVVVAFRMLPEAVWSMPPLGTFNLHASLLPQYRGAAPIPWAIINGEKHTGVTTFFLSHEIDTGAVLFRETTPVGDRETAGQLHDRLCAMGAGLVLKTVQAIEHHTAKAVPQTDLDARSPLRPAPKLTRELGHLHPALTVQEADRLVRGLSPAPAAFVVLNDPSGPGLSMKIIGAEPSAAVLSPDPGAVLSDKKTFLRLGFKDGYLDCRIVQPAGKGKMNVTDFLNGLRNLPAWNFS